MLVDKLEHYNIVTEKLDETVEFYEKIVGLVNGDRPNFKFPGAWLYAGKDPVVHLMQTWRGPRSGFRFDRSCCVSRKRLCVLQGTSRNQRHRLQRAFR